MISNNSGEDKENILAIIDNLTDGLMVFDKQGRLSLINPAACRMFDVDKTVINQTIEQFLNYPYLKNIYFLLGKGFKPITRKELEIKKNFIIEITCLPLMQQNEENGYLVVLHDISRERTVERMKAEFITISAHQFRTPLSEINWALETLARERLGKLTAGQKEALEKAYQSNKRILNLVDSFLELVKIEEGYHLESFNSFSLEELIQEIIKQNEREIAAKQIKLELRLPDKKLPAVKADRKKILLVINHLLDNAIRYNLPGGLITVNLSLKGREIEFSIEDSGIGIPQNQQSQVFHKFFRGTNALKKQTEGNGLGLFMAKNIIGAHRGKIWFKSEEGRGSIFGFTLPVK